MINRCLNIMYAFSAARNVSESKIIAYFFEAVLDLFLFRKKKCHINLSGLSIRLTDKHCTAAIIFLDDLVAGINVSNLLSTMFRS